MFHKFEDVIVHLGMFADTTQVIADDRQIVFTWVYLLDTADAFDSTLFQSMTADSVHRISRINDKSAIIQNVDNPL